MKDIDYRKIKKTLKNTYFKPVKESKKRLLKKLQIIDSKDFNEHRFITMFRIALAAVVTFVCLLNIKSVDSQYLNRYNGENIIAIAEEINDSSLLEKLILGMED